MLLCEMTVCKYSTKMYNIEQCNNDMIDLFMSCKSFWLSQISHT